MHHAKSALRSARFSQTFVWWLAGQHTNISWIFRCCNPSCSSTWHNVSMGQGCVKDHAWFSFFFPICKLCDVPLWSLALPASSACLWHGKPQALGSLIVPEARSSFT